LAGVVEDFGVEGVGIFDRFGQRGAGSGLVFERERLLAGVQGVELKLGFVAQQADKLGERDGFFGCVDDGFDLGFETHGCSVECINLRASA
jgi:hypothetical protein